MMDKIPSLSQNIALIIGLVCDSIMNCAAIDYLVMKANLSKNSNKLLTFRDKVCEGYPGKVYIQSMEGENVVLPESARMQIKDYFTPARCRVCFDKMNIFADISVGDPHGLDGVDRKMGESMLVIRTKDGSKCYSICQTE